MKNRRVTLALLVGALGLVCLQVLLLADLKLTGRGALRTDEAVRRALALPIRSHLEWAARFAAANVTALAWPLYVLLLDGLLVMFPGRGDSPPSSPLRRRRHHFWLLFLASIPIWCLFDWINFDFIRSWSYIGLPRGVFWTDLLWGYLLAFGCIVPGMLMSGQLLLNIGLFNWAIRRPASEGARRKWIPIVLALSAAGGLAMLVYPFVSRHPVANLTLWTSLVFLLDPLNYLLGRPSMFRDWFNGNFARTLAAFAGGLVCGLLWEFWNYYALAKWVYHLPFLGSLEQYRYFEMPLLGLLGFLPFAMECWVIWQTMRILLDGLVEPLPDDRTLL